jgi:alkanesulfonate monooxygenase SsuD/methylene tetrahydromethanopterin reductase-like flavin-dependent oxidoreductase (luciferase family)
MADYGSPLNFGLSITPEAADIARITALTLLADASGLDLIAIQDHAYNHTFLDIWTLMSFLAAKTEHIHFLPDVVDLPPRPPAMLAKAATTLDQLTGGVPSSGLAQVRSGMASPAWADRDALPLRP